jgi:hypothetical protein
MRWSVPGRAPNPLPTLSGCTLTELLLEGPEQVMDALVGKRLSKHGDAGRCGAEGGFVIGRPADHAEEFDGCLQIGRRLE